MLVLSRKRSESIRIGKEGIKITVLEIIGGKVKIGIEAPEHIPVYREEVWQTIHSKGDESNDPAQPAAH